MGIWLAAKPLLLASRSASRRALLSAAGIPLEIAPADIDERAIESQAGDQAPEAVAGLLARAKALAIAARHPDRLVLGADQTLALGSTLFNKPADVSGAREQLRRLRGRTHELHSAVVVASGAAVPYQHRQTARLTMRNFSDRFLDAYLEAAGSAVTASVGGYQVEGLGITLFDRIDGEHSTILGLPLLPLLEYLRHAGCLAA
jgi:septum formation protein